MGSALIGSWIAHVAFWTLLAYGWLIDELASRGVILALILWAVAVYGVPALPSAAAGMSSSALAVVDIMLVLVIFKGDVRLGGRW